MRKLLILAAVFLGLGAPAAGHMRFAAGRALLHAGQLATPTCPADVPAQAITIVNQAAVRPSALARVERAISAQSLELRAAWHTPCVQFGPGGWTAYLKVDRGEPHGEHDDYGQPYAITWTGGGMLESWSRDFSHEIVEMLVDPTASREVYRDGVGQLLEVADPVEWEAYRIDGVWVSDFVLPPWFAGATTGTPVCQGTACAYPGPFVSALDAPGPYDEMGALAAPWRIAQFST